MSSLIYTYFHPLIDFIRIPYGQIPWSIRWRLLAFQPLVVLTNLITRIPYLFSRKTYKQIWIPTRTGGPVRALIYQPPLSSTTGGKPRPIHLDLHGGGFVGGNPEADRRFCEFVAQETGAIVVSATYRFAPRYPFPAAIDDVDDVLIGIKANAERWGGDPNLITVGGSSAGGALAWASCVNANGGEEMDVKGIVTFYAPIELRLSPWQKPAPPTLPKNDPMKYMVPLFDAYPSPKRMEHMDDPRMSPILLDVNAVPKDALLIVPGIDILVHEQSEFVKRINGEIQSMGTKGEDRRIEMMYIEEAFHGWMELPFSIMEEQRARVLKKCAEFLKEVHQRYGFDIDDSR